MTDPDPMRIALCTDGVFPHALGGMQRHSRLLAENLAVLPEVRLTVLHPHEQGIFDPSLGIDEISVAPIDTEAFYFRQLWKYSDRIARELRRIAPDVIISQGFSVWKDIGEFSDRLIVHPHGLEMFQSIGLKERLIGVPFRMGLRSIMRRSAVTISLGGRITNIIEDQIRGSRSRVVVIPNAVDVPSSPTPYPAEITPLRLLFVGRFAFNKGLDILIDVAKQLEAAGEGGTVNFLLAGDGPLLQQYKETGLPGNIKLLGRVGDGDLFKLYAECHALVLPTRFEGMPTVVLEAMARCRPILVSDVGATAELVDDRNGYLLPKGDPAALLNAIRDLRGKAPELREAMGMKSYSLARENYQWPVVAKRFLRLSFELAGKGQRV